MEPKVDLKKSLDAYSARSGVDRIVTIPPQRYLMIDGHGDPNTAAGFQDAIESLFPVAYKAKLLSKSLGRDYVVMPLEGLWTAPDPSAFTTRRDKDAWQWTLLVHTPEWVDDAMVAAAIEAAGAKKAPPRLADVRLETLAEGTCVQTLHVGPFDDEEPAIARMHAHAEAEGYALTGRHHEIYLSDLRRTAPDKLRTILRQPLSPRAMRS